MRFAAAERLADTVLSEGYVLYPYRASSAKNKFRWQFGVVAPAYPNGDGVEPWFNETVCLVEPLGRASVSVRLRFLQLQERTIEEVDPSRGDARPVAQLDVDGQTLMSWQQGVLLTRTVDVPLVTGRPGMVLPVGASGARSVEHVADSRGIVRARRVKQCWPVEGQLRIHVEPAGPYLRIRARLENLVAWESAFERDRTALLRRSFVSTHLLLAADRARFVSLIDPPPEAAVEAASCLNTRMYPVLVGDPKQRSMMLSAPIALYDFPVIAPESPGDLCDATEIDEILSLRIMALTDAEKREARATDPSAARIIDRTDALTPQAMARLHGVMRPAHEEPPSADHGPDLTMLDIDRWRVTPGTHVRLRPRRRADAMDMFLRDRLATVAALRRDFEDRVYVAVTVDDDPATDLHLAVNRFFYFDPDEIEPVDARDHRSNAHVEKDVDSVGDRDRADHRTLAGDPAVSTHSRNVEEGMQ